MTVAVARAEPPAAPSTLGPAPSTGSEHDASFEAWADKREARLRAWHRRWRRSGADPGELADLVTQALADSPFTRADVAEWLAWSVRMTGALPTVGPDTLAALLRVDLVPNGPLRQAYLEGGHSPAALARHLGMVEPDGKPEVSRVERLLGLAPNGRSVTWVLAYDLAVRLADVLGVEPHAAGV